MGFPGGTSGKESACQSRRHKRLGFHPWVGKIPWSRKWHPTPEILPGRSRGQRSLGSYSPWGHKESSKTDHTHAHTHTHTQHSSEFLPIHKCQESVGQDLPGGPVIKTLCSQFRGYRLNPQSGLDLNAKWLDQTRSGRTTS